MNLQKQGLNSQKFSFNYIQGLIKIINYSYFVFLHVIPIELCLRYD